MIKIFASAPGRVFLSGESAAEFGARTLMIPAEFEGKRNTVTFSFLETTGNFTAYDGSRTGTLMPTGRTRGDDALRVPLEAAKAALLANGYSPDRLDASFSMSLDCPAPATAGRDAAVCAAIFAGVFEYLGNKSGSRAAFRKGYSVPGSQASEADAIQMASDSPMAFRREFLLDGTTKIAATELRVSPPQGTVFLYADPAEAENRSFTDVGRGLALANRVVKASGKAKSAKEMTTNERAGICGAFSEITDRLCREMSSRSASPDKVASLLGLEHSALCDAGVLSDGTRAAAAAATQAGALAAKASGPQGALLVLAYENDAGKVSAALAREGYAACGIRVSQKGMASDTTSSP